MMDKSDVYRYVAGVAAGEGAYFISSITNQAVLETFNYYIAVGISAPLVEELTKNGITDAIGGDHLLSHTTFGSTEGMLYQRSRVVSKDGKEYITFDEEQHTFDFRRPLLHACFGTLFLLGLRFSGRKAVGYLVAMIAHMLWNHAQLAIAAFGELKTEHLIKSVQKDQTLRELFAYLKPHFRSWSEAKSKLLI